MEVVWSSLAWPGTEHVAWADSSGLRADSIAVHALPGGPVRVRYKIAADPSVRTRQVAIDVAGSDHTNRLALRADDDGMWFDDDGRPIAELRGCQDVDISCTPLTNTLPIRRLGLTPGSSAELEVAYIAVPQLKPQKRQQRYTRLQDRAGNAVYRYESGSFRADLTIDEHSLVVHYPGLWQLVDSRDR